MRKGQLGGMIIGTFIVITSVGLTVVTYQNNQNLKKEIISLKDSHQLEKTNFSQSLDEKQKALEEIESSIAGYKEASDSYKIKYDELEVAFNELQRIHQLYTEKHGYDPTIAWTLDRYNLTIDQVEFSLLSNPEVIKQAPVLGGTFYFTRVLMLTSNWVFGAFEDGHIIGFGIYTYTITEDGLVWREILSNIDSGELESK